MMDPGDIKEPGVPRTIAQLRERVDMLQAWKEETEPVVDRHERGLFGFWDQSAGKMVPGMVQKQDATIELAQKANEEAAGLRKMLNKGLYLLAMIACLIFLNVIHAYGLAEILGKAFSGVGAP